MSMWTLLVALVCALIVWYLIARQLTAQPWLVAGDAGQPADTGIPGYPAKKMALYMFLAVISSLFALFFSAYIMRMDPHHGGDWHSIPKPAILWLNTLLLVCASITIERARRAAAHQQRSLLTVSLAAAGVFTLLFLGGQLYAWLELHDAGTLHLSNPALGFFYLLTGVHAAHLIGGLYVWARALYRVSIGMNTPSIILGVELCAVYWHYLLLIWLVLFGLLLTT